MVRVGVVGCAHGRFDAIYAHIDAYNSATARDGTHPVELLLCCGDVQCLRNTNDLESQACPRKYQRMNEFHEYYSGQKRASVLTIVIGGNHEASNYFQELYYGGWIAPNMFYLGAAGVVNVLGLRIAGLSGIYDPSDYRRGHYERAPYTKKALYSVFHTRESEVFQLSHLTGNVDIVLSHDWPRKIEEYGDKEALLKKRPSFQTSIEIDNFGSYGGETLLHTLRPKHWFAGHMHIRFEANVIHPSDEAGKSQRSTHFIGLDKCLPERSWLEMVDMEPEQTNAVETNGDPRVFMDVEWLAILRATHHIMSRSPNYLSMPTQLIKAEASDVAWVQQRLIDRTPNGSHVGEWPEHFQMTAPSLAVKQQAPWPNGELGNPQTDALLALLELPHVVTSPYRPEAMISDDSEDSDRGSDKEWDIEDSSSDDGTMEREIHQRNGDNDAFLESLDSLSFGF